MEDAFVSFSGKKSKVKAAVKELEERVRIEIGGNPQIFFKGSTDQKKNLPLETTNVVNDSVTAKDEIITTDETNTSEVIKKKE